MTDTNTSDLERAEAIQAQLSTLLGLIDADAEARAGRGGAIQVLANIRQTLAHSASEHARSFNLPWAGPTIPVPAIPTGGE